MSKLSNLPVTRCTGASKWKNVSCSIIRAQISDPTPEKENKKLMVPLTRKLSKNLVM